MLLFLFPAFTLHDRPFVFFVGGVSRASWTQPAKHWDRAGEGSVKAQKEASAIAGRLLN